MLQSWTAYNIKSQSISFLSNNTTRYLMSPLENMPSSPSLIGWGRPGSASHGWGARQCQQSVERRQSSAGEIILTSEEEEEEEEVKEEEEEGEEGLPWLQNDCIAQPDSHFASAAVDDAGNENTLSFFCSDLNHSVNLSQFCLSTRLQRSLFLLYTSSKWNSISCCLESRVACSTYFTQSVKSSCVLSIFHRVVGCIWHSSLTQSMFKTNVT